MFSIYKKKNVGAPLAIACAADVMLPQLGLTRG